MGIAGLGRLIWRWVKGKVLGLTQLKDQPHAVSLGVAVGIFFGFIPLFGFKTLLAIGFARLMRGNVVAAAIAVTLHDVILPVAPVLLRWQYQLGFWILSHPHHLPAPLKASQQGFELLLHWSTFAHVGPPLMLGSTLVAVPFTIGSYFLTLWWLARHNAKKAKEAAEAEPLIIVPGQPAITGKKTIIVPVSVDSQKP